MKVFCLGCAGKISREGVLDLVEFGDFERVTIGDINIRAAEDVAAWIGGDRVDVVSIDVYDEPDAVGKLAGYDIVMDGTPISVNGRSTRCIALAGCHGINLNGFGEEYRYDGIFKEKSRVMVPGFGMTPGTTNMMAVHAGERLDTVEEIRCSHGAFRPVAFSEGIAETTAYEYDPDLPGRVVFEDGELKQVPPFARPLDVPLPEPFGTHPEYIIPHSETVTLSDYFKDRGIRLVEVRGTWPPKNMQLVRTLYDWGFLRNERVRLGEAEFGIMDAIAAYLCQSEAGRTTDLYGYALHVEVVGTVGGRRYRHKLTHTHPKSDGSVPGWEHLRAYTQCVAIPLAIGVQLIAQGRFKGRFGALIPERVFHPADVFEELKNRNIHIHETVTAEEDEE